MPIISVTMGQLDARHKNALIKELTSTTVNVTKIPEQSFTVLIHELEDQNIGVGGKPLAEVKKAQ